mgnify:CR=1 FL=1
MRRLRRARVDAKELLGFVDAAPADAHWPRAGSWQHAVIYGALPTWACHEGARCCIEAADGTEREAPEAANQLARALAARRRTPAQVRANATEHHWAVIVAGSNSFANYRHQADACHAYQIMKKNGVPESNIILMMYDDIAGNAMNPFPGQVFNKPTAAGVPGVDVYDGCVLRGGVVATGAAPLLPADRETAFPGRG